MVDKNQFLSELNEALILEEIQVLPFIDQIIRELKASSLDEMIKTEVEEKLWILKVESINHAKMITGLMKQVMASEKDEY